MSCDLRYLTLLTLLSLAACGDQTADSAALGRIEGRLSRGPIMPVCRVDVPCDGPYAQAKVVAAGEGGDVVGRATADANGEFALDVAAGSFVVSIEVEGALPRCAQARVVVAAGATVRADIDCDTGIR